MCSKEEKYPLHILGIKYQIPRGDWVAGENRNAYSLEKEKLCGSLHFLSCTLIHKRKGILQLSSFSQAQQMV